MFPAVNISGSAPYPPSRILNVAGAFAVSGNNVLVAAPPVGSEIVVCYFYIQNTTATPTTVKLLAGSFAFFLKLCPANDPGVLISYPQGQEARCGNTVGIPNALIANLSGANAHNIVIGYWVDGQR